MQLQVRISTDAVWHFNGAKAVLSGEKITSAAIDPNPPLVFMIYAPAAGILNLGLPVWTSITLYGFLLVLGCAFLSAQMIFRWPGLEKPAAWALLGAWLAAVTIFSKYEFAQKDHLLAVPLLAFSLAQLFITYNYKAPKWVIRSALILGTPFILVKPYYGLLPVVLLLHRFVRQKKFSIVFDFDFLCLAAGVITYGIALLVFFPDYLAVSLPEGLLFYATQINLAVWPQALAIAAACASLATLAVFSGQKKSVITLAVFLNILAAAAALGFAMQLKGWSVQLLPAVCLLFPAAALTAFLFIKVPKKYESAAPSIIVLGFFSLALFLPPIHLKRTTHDDYRNSPLVAYIKENAAGSSFFMETWRTDVIGAAAEYAGVPHASRFPGVWFASPIARSDDEKARERFAGYFAEDLAHYKPAFVAVFHDPPEPGAGMLELLGKEPAFKKEWRHYRKSGAFKYQYGEFSKDPGISEDTVIVYDVYKRID